VPFTCLRGDVRVGAVLADLACDSRSTLLGLAVPSFRGRPGPLFGDETFCCCFPLLTLRCIVCTFRGEDATTISSASSVGLRLFGIVKGLKKSLIVLPLLLLAGIAVCVIPSSSSLQVSSVPQASR